MLDSEENGEIFSEGALGKGKLPLLWDNVVMVPDKKGLE